MAEYLLLEVLALAVAFGLGYLTGRPRQSKVKIPDHVPADWKISE